MTTPETSKVRCPACGQPNDAEIWTGVDMVAEPEAAQWLIDGFLFEFTCASCGASAKLNHNFVLRNPKSRTLIAYLASQAQADAAAQSLEKLRANGWTARLVDSRDALREKAALLRDGLDDRAVEMAKFALKARFVKEGQIAEESRARYGASSEEGIVVEFVGIEAPLETTVPADIYKSLEETLDDDQPLLVNEEWAAEALRLRGWTPDDL